MNALISAFEAAFRDKIYRHRASTTGDIIASHMYDDLLDLAISKKYGLRVEQNLIVVNTSNKIKGKKGRRGDGTLGRLVPGEKPTTVAPYKVRRGPVATLQIGAEVKIMATKMIAQIDRVMNDLENQAKTFRRFNRSCIRVGIVGVNHAQQYTGYEKDRQHDAAIPPAREAAEVIRRIQEAVTPHYDELLIMRYVATNRPPFAFSWVNANDTTQLYGSALVRISELYDVRFP
jgi:hypothetical protein